MSEIKKNNPTEEKNNLTEELKNKEVSLDDLDEVSGGAAFANIPRVPTKEIDDSVRDKI